MAFVNRDLFGGAITSDLPADWKDVSDARPVPDNQEIFLEDSDDPKMLIVEIVEQEDVQDEDAAKFFFDDLAEQNDALQNEDDIRFVALDDHASPTALLNDETVLAGANTVRVCAGFGYQKVALGRDQDIGGNSRRANQEIRYIRVDLFVLRLPVQETDLLITMSSPADGATLDEVALENFQAASAILDRALSTFRIENWDLFG